LPFAGLHLYIELGGAGTWLCKERREIDTCTYDAKNG
jgi:hypothetical protein